MTVGRDYPQAVATLLAHATVLTVLLGAARKNENRLTLQVRGDGRVPLLVADCDSNLKIRGMAQWDRVVTPQPGEDLRALLGNGRIVLTLEDSATRQLYQSIVPLDGSDIKSVFEHYIEQSEQRPAYLRLFASRDSASGLLLEKLPQADMRDPDGWNRVTQLASTLQSHELLDAHPHTLLTRLFPDETVRAFALDQVEYDCPFDPAKVRDVLRGPGSRRSRCPPRRAR